MLTISLRAGERLVDQRAARAPRCPRRSSGRRGRRRPRSARRRPGPPGSSAARRRRRSWAGGPCGRRPARRRRPGPPRRCRRRRRARGSRRPRRCPCVAAASRSTRRARVGEEVLLEQQVLGRVAGERELGEEHELGAAGAGARELLDDRGARCRRCRRRSGSAGPARSACGPQYAECRRAQPAAGAALRARGLRLRAGGSAPAAAAGRRSRCSSWWAISSRSGIAS